MRAAKPRTRALRFSSTRGRYHLCGVMVVTGFQKAKFRSPGCLLGDALSCDGRPPHYASANIPIVATKAGCPGFLCIMFRRPGSSGLGPTCGGSRGGKRRLANGQRCPSRAKVPESCPRWILSPAPFSWVHRWDGGHFTLMNRCHMNETIYKATTRTSKESNNPQEESKEQSRYKKNEPRD